MTFGKKVRFIDLFAGIGGFHHAALKVFPDAECVMAVEWDKDCQKVYSTMFPETDLRWHRSGPRVGDPLVAAPSSS